MLQKNTFPHTHTDEQLVGGKVVSAHSESVDDFRPKRKLGAQKTPPWKFREATVEKRGKLEGNFKIEVALK
jgi:hypothetical protein